MDQEDNSTASYSSLIQLFNQFLLDQMANEANSTSTSNPNLLQTVDTPDPSSISQLFGLHTKTATICPDCGSRSTRDSVKHLLDLVYPRKVSSVSDSRFMTNTCPASVERSRCTHRLLIYSSFLLYKRDGKQSQMLVL